MHSMVTKNIATLPLGLLLACGLMAVLALSADAKETTAATPGLVAEQPTEGHFVKTEQGYMVPYSVAIPGSDVAIEMIPVPGGVFTFGSAADDEERGDNELEAVEVKLPPFWVAKTELTWAAYWKYMELNEDFAKLESISTMLVSDNAAEATAAKQAVAKHPSIAVAIENAPTDIDGITAPTSLYDPDTTYESGMEPQQPAVTMTPYAAKQFTKWLSLITGTPYRLPTEAEWEYAARAGSTTAYPWGESADDIDEYAWYDDNSDWQTQLVGQKKPNAWGLHDMIGNAAEWVIDEYQDEVEWPADRPLSWEQAIQKPTSYEGRLLRGGYYESAVEDSRSTSRMASEDEYLKTQDPNSPKSPWWYTESEAGGIGMRIVRPLEPLTPELAKLFWEVNSEDMAFDVRKRIAGRRGKWGAATPNLPKVQAAMQSDEVKKLLGDN